MIKVLVTGSPNYRNQRNVNDKLDQICAYYGDILIIHGNDGGASGCAHRWAGESHVVHVAVPGLWGVTSDPYHERRNAGILELKPDVCVIFGEDRWGLGRAARAAGVDTYEL